MADNQRETKAAILRRGGSVIEPREPTLRETITYALMGRDKRPSPERRSFVQGLMGGGPLGFGFVDLIPGIGTALAVQEEAQEHGLRSPQAHLAMVPMAAAPRTALRQAVRKGAEHAERLAANGPVMYPVPAAAGDRRGNPLPPRTFEDDYGRLLRRKEVIADADGKLLKDMDGRDLTAPLVVGRRTFGGEDVPVTAQELAPLGTKVTGHFPEVAEPSKMGSNEGRYLKRWGMEGGDWTDKDAEGWVRQILTRADLPADEVDLVLAHEIGHAFDDVAGRQGLLDSIVPFGAIPLDEKATAQLGQVYHDLNSPSGRGRKTKPEFQYTPKDKGYADGEVRDELAAEAIRAYLGSPAYFKKVAPRAAEAIRKAVNEHPILSKIIQFNTVAPAALAGSLAAGVSGEGEEGAASPESTAGDPAQAYQQQLLKRGLKAF